MIGAVGCERGLVVMEEVGVHPKMGIRRFPFSGSAGFSSACHREVLVGSEMGIGERGSSACELGEHVSDRLGAVSEHPVY